MKNRHSLAMVLGVGYCLLLAFFLLNSGAGHDWGTGAIVVASMPLGLVAIGLYHLFPTQDLGFLFPILGLLQWIVIGYLIGRRIDKKSGVQ